jgi:hypothetical protein
MVNSPTKPNPKPKRPKPKPSVRKYYKVELGTRLTIAEVNQLIVEGYTHYTFPDGMTPEVLPLIGYQCIGEELIYFEPLKQYMWSAVMEKGWKPVDPHK